MIIPAKEYMNNPGLTDHIIPPDVTCVGEWAFARCKNLHTIHIPAGCAVSNRAFEKCPSLSEVYIYDGSPDNPLRGYPHLLALALRTWDHEAAVLIDNAADAEALTDHLDSRLFRYINTPDEDGFDPFLAGGEEDYDNTGALNDHIRNVRLSKANLIYERLTIKAPLSDKLKDAVMEQLISNNPDISFGVLTPQTDHNKPYRDLYFDLGLDKLTDPESLLSIAGNDTKLRAMVLEHNHGGKTAIDNMIL